MMVYATSDDAPKQRVCSICGQTISPYHYAEHMVEVHGVWDKLMPEERYDDEIDIFDIENHTNREF